jgi:hypothetical protein
MEATVGTGDDGNETPSNDMDTHSSNGPDILQYTDFDLDRKKRTMFLLPIRIIANQQFKIH